MACTVQTIFQNHAFFLWPKGTDPHNLPSGTIMKATLTLSALALAGTISLSSAVNILVSANDTSQIEAFLSANYTNANVTAAGNFSDFGAQATQDALVGVDLVIIGRSLSSFDYQNGRADGYNGLNIPVLNFTSYTARNVSNRMGWHTGSASANQLVAGAETTITAAGSSLLGIPEGNYDFFDTNVGSLQWSWHRKCWRRKRPRHHRRRYSCRLLGNRTGPWRSGCSRGHHVPGTPFPSQY